MAETETSKRITFCAWESQSKKGGRFAHMFTHFNKYVCARTGLHSALLLFQSKDNEQSLYPFNAALPLSAYPRRDVTSILGKNEIVCCRGRGDIERDNPHVSRVDAYVNFIPRQGESASAKANTFDALNRSSELVDGKLEFMNDPYEEAVEEYYVYRHGRKQERVPEVLISIPVQTATTNGLDYDRMQLWWALVNKSDEIRYKYFTSNCATGTLMALRAGGSDRFLEYKRRPLLPVTPKRVSNYSKEAASAIEKSNQKKMSEDSSFLVRYVRKLVAAIQKHKKIEMPDKVERIDEKFKIEDFKSTASKYRVEKQKTFKQITKLLNIAQTTKNKDVRFMQLRQVQHICADYVFHNPASNKLNLMANLMTAIDREADKNLELWYSLADPQLKLVAQLKEYSEHKSSRFSLFNQGKKKIAIQEFFKKHPNPTIDDMRLLKKQINKLGSVGRANSLVNSAFKKYNKTV